MLDVQGLRVRHGRIEVLHQISFTVQPQEIVAIIGANGAGKSTIWSALKWCLCGKTTVDLFGPAIKSWEQFKVKATRVTLSFKRDNDDIKISRTQTPNTITFVLNGNAKPIDQDSLYKQLNLSETDIDNAIILSQSHEYFLELKPAKRLEMFSDILDLDK